MWPGKLRMSSILISFVHASGENARLAWGKVISGRDLEEGRDLEKRQRGTQLVPGWARHSSPSVMGRGMGKTWMGKNSSEVRETGESRARRWGKQINPLANVCQQIWLWCRTPQSVSWLRLIQNLTDFLGNLVSIRERKGKLLQGTLAKEFLLTTRNKNYNAVE